MMLVPPSNEGDKMTRGESEPILRISSKSWGCINGMSARMLAVVVAPVFIDRLVACWIPVLRPGPFWRSDFEPCLAAATITVLSGETTMVSWKALDACMAFKTSSSMARTRSLLSWIVRCRERRLLASARVLTGTIATVDNPARGSPLAS